MKRSSSRILYPILSAVMSYFIRNARVPFSYSFATDIYRLMPNGTDFTCFTQRGFTGYNLAVLDNLDYYHTNKDIFANINLSSLQHYGEQVWPIVKQFAFTPSDKLPSLKSQSSDIFFNILPGIIIHYTRSTSIIILVLVITLSALLFGFLLKKV